MFTVDMFVFEIRTSLLNPLEASMTMTRIAKHEPRSNHTRDDDEATLNGSADLSDDPATPPEEATPPDSQGVKAAKAFGIGLACVVGIPVVAALGTVGGVLYGAGKILEGVGKAIAVGPEAAFNAMDGDQEQKSKPASQRPGKKSE